MHNCAFMSDQLQIEPDITERTTGPSIKTAKPTSFQPGCGYFCAHLAQRDPRDHSTLKPPQGLAQWFNCV